VACVGNSITDGHGIEMATQHGYPALLQKKLAYAKLTIKGLFMFLQNKTL
jgi:hypothetical protein